MALHISAPEILYRHLCEIEESGIYSNYGPKHEELTQRLAVYFDCEPSQVGIVSNATLGLAGVISVSTEHNADISVPSWTFAASAHAVRLANRNLVIRDIADDCYDELGKLEYSSCGGANPLLVAPFGYLSKSLLGVAEKGKAVVLDAASCFSALRGIGKKIDLESSVPFVVSAHATKGFTMGEGGVVLGSSSLISDVTTWSNFGFRGSRTSRFISANAKASEYACAVGLTSLSIWPEIEAALFSTHEIYDQNLTPNVQRPRSFENGWVTATYVIELEEQRKLPLCQAFESKIEWRDWWSNGLHEMDVFKAFCDNSAYTRTNSVVTQSIGLPFGNGFSYSQINLVCELVNGVFA